MSICLTERAPAEEFPLQLRIPDLILAPTPHLVEQSHAFIELPNLEETSKEAQKIKKTFQKTLKIWKEFLEDRVGVLRAALQENPEQEKTLRPQLNDDQRLKEEYLELSSRFKNKCIEPRRQTCHIIALTDKNGLVQGFCDYEMKETTARVHYVYLHTLFTAPWNLRLNAPVPLTHRGVCMKGVGITLFKEVYRHAMVVRCSSIQLKPLPNSESFYENRLHMGRTVDEENHYNLVMPVTGSFPQELEERT